MRSLYHIGIRAYTLGIKLAAAFGNEKAKLWVRGRKDWKQELRSQLSVNDRWIWFHCASLGEFEQGRSLIEAIREQYPYYKILLSFFSPSGYEVRKNYSGADFVCYLPADSPANARDFLDILQPKFVFFIKYDIWVNYLLEIGERNIPAYLVSTLLKPESKFLKGRLAGLYQQAFQAFEHIFSQDEATRKLLKNFVPSTEITVAGDTRFDRAAALPGQFRPVPHLPEFKGDHFLVVLGSLWPKEEEILLPLIKSMKDLPVRWVIAPHEIDRERIRSHIAKWPDGMCTYSGFSEADPGKTVLWIDNVGMLNRLYHYADLTYVGGNQKSIHNTQEPAAYGKVVLFGSNHTAFREAVDMVEQGSAFVVPTADQFRAVFERLYQNREELARLGALNASYMEGQGGATRKIMETLESRLKLPFSR